jgi:hypothetical protein
MTRIERALRIQQQVLEIAATDPFYMHTNSGLAQVAYGLGWNARIHTLLYPERRRRFVLGPIDLPPGHRRSPRLPNRMCIWLNPGAKVFTLEWWNDIFRLVTFRRGDWEADCFGLPPYVGSAGLRPYELYTRRSRRW